MGILSLTRIAPFGGRLLLSALLLWPTWLLPVMAGETGNWVLRGTVVLDGQSGYAIVEQPGTRSQSWRHTSTDILPGMHLMAVFADHAIVMQNNKRRQIHFGSRLTARAGGDTYHIDPMKIPAMAAAVDIIPQQQNGRIVGYYANGIPANLRSKLGLQPGDLLRRINGIPLDDQLKPARLYEMLHTGQLQVDVIRSGQPIQLVYQVGR